MHQRLRLDCISLGCRLRLLCDGTPSRSAHRSCWCAAMSSRPYAPPFSAPLLWQTTCPALPLRRRTRRRTSAWIPRTPRGTKGWPVDAATCPGRGKLISIALAAGDAVYVARSRRQDGICCSLTWCFFFFAGAPSTSRKAPGGWALIWRDRHRPRLGLPLGSAQKREKGRQKRICVASLPT